MLRPRPSLALALAAVFLLPMLAPDMAAAKKKKKKVYWYQYAVPFTCGDNQTDPGRMLIGDHSSAIRVFNPGSDATLYSGLALDFPLGMLLPGWTSDRIETALPAGTATQASCQDALDLAAQNPPPPFAIPPYVQGFAIVQSSRPLEVHVTRSVVTAGGAVTMATQKVAPVLISPPSAP